MIVFRNKINTLYSQADKKNSVERTDHVYIEASDNFQKKNTFRKDSLLSEWIPLLKIGHPILASIMA